MKIRILFLLFLLSVLIISCSSENTVESEIVQENEIIQPKTGQYKGDGISFTLSEDGKITNIILDGYLGSTTFVDCRISFPESSIEESNIINIEHIFPDSEVKNTFYGKFSTSETINGKYYLQWCLIGNQVSMETKSVGGESSHSWDAIWVSE